MVGRIGKSCPGLTRRDEQTIAARPGKRVMWKLATKRASVPCLPGAAISPFPPGPPPQEPQVEEEKFVY